jgi:WD40 repeat protein
VTRIEKIGLGLLIALGIAVCLFLVAVALGEGLLEASLWAGIVAALASVISTVVVIWQQANAGPKAVLPPAGEVPEWVVDRPAEMSQVTEALLRDSSGTVGITTGLIGAGGFGKTTLARVVCADGRVRQRFGGRVYDVTIGRDIRSPAAIAAKVNGVIKLMSGTDAAWADPQQAGQQLGALLDTGPPRLLVIDDVWLDEQLAPFVDGGRQCARLVTTRVPGILAGRGTTVLVDQMSRQQARTLLTYELPALEPEKVEELLAVTGNWPLLLRLVNKILASATRTTQDISPAAAQLLDRLRSAGPAAVDTLLGESALDVSTPAKRARAVRATVDASMSLLAEQDAARFAELAVFAEDEAIPFPLVQRIWQATGGLDMLEATQVCNRLGELALVTIASPDAGAGEVALHDVLRDYLRNDLGPDRLREIHCTLLDEAAAGLPQASGPSGPDSATPPASWWDLPEADSYMWEHLIEHLIGAGRLGEATALARDLRWVDGRLMRFGPAAAAADLALAGTDETARLRIVLVRTAHLLAATVPAEAVVDVLHSRVSDDPDWGLQVTALRDSLGRPRLVNRWPLPDLPDPALIRVLAGHTMELRAMAIAPDSTWLVTGSNDFTARIWDVATGQTRATLTGHEAQITAVAIAPDGTWLATVSNDNTARIWDAATGQTRAVIGGRGVRVGMLAVSPDSSWIVTGAAGGTVRIWDAATGKARPALGTRDGLLWALALAPNGSWLVTSSGGRHTSDDMTLTIWDIATGQARATLTNAAKYAWALAISPDSAWLASNDDHAVQIWDAATGLARITYTGHDREVRELAIAPDSSWLASRDDQTVRIWDAATGQDRGTVSSSRDEKVMAVAISPDGSWFATSGSHQKIRIWDAATCQLRATFSNGNGWANVLAIPADGTWLAAGGSNGSGQAPVAIWDTTSDHARGPGSIEAHAVQVLAAAPDGTWVVTSDYHRIGRIWDAATGQVRASFTSDDRVVHMVIAPDGTWLATRGTGGPIRIWDAVTGQARMARVGDDENGDPDLATGLAIAPDGTWLATGEADGTARIWDAATGQPRATFGGRAAGVSALAISCDGTWLGTGHADGSVRIWDAATGDIRAAHAGHASGNPFDMVTSMAIAPDGTWLATACHNQNRVLIWDAAAGEVRATLAIQSPFAGLIATAPDSSWLATTSRDEGLLQIWDAATGQLRATLTGRTFSVTDLAISPDGARLAVVGSDRTVRIWDASAPHECRAMMRVDTAISVCGWLGSAGLALGGPGGLYGFDYLDD